MIAGDIIGYFMLRSYITIVRRMVCFDGRCLVPILKAHPPCVGRSAPFYLLRSSRRRALKTTDADWHPEFAQLRRESRLGRPKLPF